MSRRNKQGSIAPARPAGSVSRRVVLQGIGAAASAAVVGLEAPYVNAADKVIRFLNGEPSAESVRALRVAAAQYEKVKGIKVQIDSVPTARQFERVQASIAGGSPYDIGTLSFAGDMLILANAKKLVPLNSLINKYKWGPNILFPIEGNNYWYPYDYNLCWVNYRADLYKEKNLKEPTTWQELAANLAALQGTGKDRLPHGIVHPLGSNDATSYTAFGYLWASGVKIFDDQWNVVLDSPDMTAKTIEYLDFMADLTKYMPPAPIQASWNNLVGDFQTDKVSHTPGTGRLIDTMVARMPERAANVRSFLFPSKDGKTFAVNHGYDGWIVLDTPMSEESLKFMEWFSDEHFINFLHTSPVHYQPTRLDVYDDPRWLAHPLLEQFAPIVEMQKRVLFDKNVVIRSIDTEGPYPDVRAGKVFRSFALPEMLQNRIVNNMPAAQCVTVAAGKIREAIKA